jgi:large subunit ribosomal protein L35
MPKMKTNKGAAKRMRLTGTGKVRRGKAGKGHLMRGKSGSRLRRLRKNDTLPKGDAKRIRRLLQG